MITIKSQDREYGYSSYLSPHDTPERIVGKILTLIEAVGLPDKQETALKSLVKQKVYEEFSPEYSSPIIPSNLTSMIRELIWEDSKISAPEGEPKQTLNGDIEIKFTPKQ